LPNAEAAVVEKEKIVGYLLSATHRYGANKARFFIQFGFRAGAWERLAHALLDQARRSEVTRTRQTGFGPRYEIDAKLSCPDGRHPMVRSVWQMDDGKIAPRLITAYPLEDT